MGWILLVRKSRCFVFQISLNCMVGIAAGRAFRELQSGSWSCTVLWETTQRRPCKDWLLCTGHGRTTEQNLSSSCVRSSCWKVTKHILSPEGISWSVQYSDRGLTFNLLVIPRGSKSQPSWDLLWSFLKGLFVCFEESCSSVESNPDSGCRLILEVCYWRAWAVLLLWLPGCMSTQKAVKKHRPQVPLSVEACVSFLWPSLPPSSLPWW